jgi:hypothetical protein
MPTTTTPTASNKFEDDPNLTGNEYGDDGNLRLFGGG